jgi:hypothetical protein
VPVSKTVTHYWGEFVNTLGVGGTVLNPDLYAECPVGMDPWGEEAAPGDVETNIYNIVQAPTGADIFQIILEVLGVITLVTLIPTIEAIINGGLFLAPGPNAAHYTYDIGPITNFIALAGSETQPYVSISSPSPV